MYRRTDSFFFNDSATTEIYTLSLHDALPILLGAVLEPDAAAAHRNVLLAERRDPEGPRCPRVALGADAEPAEVDQANRSEEHTSELQSRQYLVCRLLLEKKTTLHPLASHHIL